MNISPAMQERLTSFRDALAAAGLTLSEEAIVDDAIGSFLAAGEVALLDDAIDPTRKPHVLHATWHGDHVTYTLDCPWGDETGQPERPCNLVNENPDGSPNEPEGEYDRESPEWIAYDEAMDEYEAWVPVPGCFAVETLAACGSEIIDLHITDPVFPLEVDLEVDGSYDDATVTIIERGRA